MEIKLNVNVNGQKILLWALVAACIWGFVYGANKGWDGYQNRKELQETRTTILNFEKNKDHLSMADSLLLMAIIHPAIKGCIMRRT